MNKNKLLIKIFIPIIALLIIALLTLYFLGSKTRIGYLTDFNLNIEETLELNDLDDFAIGDEFYEESVKNYLLTNENITNYVYRFRIRYYDKVFRNSDIYGVYPDLSNLPDYVKEAEMDGRGSPYGNFISDKKSIEEEKIDNVNYTLKPKPLILYIVVIIAIILLLIISNTLDIKFNVNKYFDSKINNLSCIIILLLLVFIIMFFSLKLYNFKFGLPLIYDRNGDEITFFIPNLMIKEAGWYPVQTDRLGAPFGSYLGVFPATLMCKFEILLSKIISIFISDPIDVSSISYFIIFPITAFVSFFVLRSLKISKFISIFGSLAFSFIPFVFMRNISHYVLSAIYFIPISILLCIWLYENNDLLMPTKNLKDFKKNKKNIIAIIFIILISNNGIAYYPFFTCFLIVITCISKLLKTKNIKTSIPFIISIALVIVLFIINLLPLIIYKSQHSYVSNINRWFFEAEMAGLKISHLILNPKYFLEYYSQAMLVNENKTSYLGVIGALGFIGLILYIFIKNYYKPLISDYKNRISLLSELNLFAVLLATIGGFSSIFNYFITPMIRSYNRISVYIAFICILAFCMFIDKIIRNRNIVFYIAFSIILLFTLYDQNQDTKFYNKKEMQLYIQDKKFIQNIEKVMQEKSSIYQLPTVAYDDTIPLVRNKYKHYRLFIGYIFSKKLKWSYGAETGRVENEWYKKVNEMDAHNLLNEISYAGFDGLYIDKKLFGNKEVLNKLEEDLKNILRQEPMIHESGDILFFDLTNFETDKEYVPIIKEYK